MKLTLPHVIYLMHFVTRIKKRLNYYQKYNLCSKLVNGKRCKSYLTSYGCSKCNSTGIPCSNFCGDEVEFRGDYCSEDCRYDAFKYHQRTYY